MAIPEMMLASGAGLCLVAWVLYILFGQTTVRKLRKNPETKGALGVSFVSGWDIFNVASALSTPRWLIERYRKSRLAFLAANADAIYPHTNRYDRILARIFYGIFTASGVLMFVAALILKLTGE